MARRLQPAHPNVVDLDGKPYYLGMQWYAYPSVPSRADIQEEADIKGASTYTLREGESAVQVAFCGDCLDDLPSGTASLAAHLADSARQPWLGLFQIAPDRWWYIAVRDHNAILPDGDVIGTEAEAMAARDAHSGFTDWRYLSGNIDDLERMLGETATKAARLRSVRRTPRERRRQMVAAGVSGLFVAAAAASAWYFVDQQEQESAQLRRIQSERVKQGKIEAAKSAFVSPFYLTPPPGKLITACHHVFSTTAVSLHGWVADQISCDQSAATIRWVRSDGASVRAVPAGVISEDGEKVTQSIPFQLASENPEALAKLDEVRLALLAWCQEGGFTVRFSPVPAPKVPEGIDPKDLPPDLPAVSFAISTNFSPFALREDLESYPGLRLISMTEISSGWSIQGVLYGQR